MVLIDCISDIPKYLITPFTLKQGNVMLLFMPVGEDIKVCKTNKYLYPYVNYQPYWVRFNLEKIDRESEKIINDNFAYLYPFFSSKFDANYQFNKNELLNLSGWDIRLINLFLMRKRRGIEFFELNIAGLSVSSLMLMFKFILNELSECNYKTTYLIIEPNNRIEKSNPVFINEDNLDDIYQKIYMTQ